ncbi:MAG: DNA-binding response OmpR family regulator [Candidatus Azotimanducaceae bacterium]
MSELLLQRPDTSGLAGGFSIDPSVENLSRSFAVAGCFYSLRSELFELMVDHGCLLDQMSIEELMTKATRNYSIALIGQHISDQALLRLVVHLREENPRLGIFVFGSSTDIGVMSSLIEVGVDDYVHKRFDHRDVFSRINAMLRLIGHTPLARQGERIRKMLTV